jgi:alcohol dehydrogenase
LSEDQAAARAVTAIETLNLKIGIPARLRDLGARKEQIPEFAQKALGIARIIRVNPRVPKLEEVVGLLNEAY